MSQAIPARRSIGGDRRRRRLSARSLERPIGRRRARRLAGSSISIASRSIPAAQPTAGRVRAAEALDQAVIAAAGDHRALRAESSVTNSKAVWR